MKLVAQSHVYAMGRDGLLCNEGKCAINRFLSVYPQVKHI